MCNLNKQELIQLSTDFMVSNNSKKTKDKRHVPSLIDLNEIFNSK